MKKLRIVLSTLALLALFGCETSNGVAVDDVDDDPIASETSKVTPAPCGLWWGASQAEADARGLSELPTAQFYTDGWGTCVDGIHACILLHNRFPERFCQVRYVYSSAIVCGIGTSPSVCKVKSVVGPALIGVDSAAWLSDSLPTLP